MRYLLLCLVLTGCFHDSLTEPKAKWAPPHCQPGFTPVDTLWMHGSMEGQYALLCGK